MRIATILDVILATSFYYKKAHLWSFNRKEYRTSFALLLWEGYNQLMDWYEVGGEEDYERVSYSDKLFDEFLLETSRTDFSRFDLWRNAIKQYRIVSKYGLQRLDSRLKNIFDKHPRESFVFSNRVWGNFYLFTLVSTVLSGGLVLFTLLHLFYKFYVVKSRLNGRVLTVKDGSTKNKAQVVLDNYAASNKTKFGLYFDSKRFDYEEDNPFVSPKEAEDSTTVGVPAVGTDGGNTSVRCEGGSLVVRPGTGFEGMNSLTLYDAAGRCLLRTEAASVAGVIVAGRPAGLSEGLYMIRVENGMTKAVRTLKFIHP